MARSGSAFRRAGITLLVGGILLVSSCGARDWQSELDTAVSASSQGPEQLVKRLEEFLDKDPPLKYASEVRFTIGFTYAEGLHQYREAHRWFTELLDSDPDGAWAEEAQWMLENMEKGAEELLPELREEVPPPRQRQTGSLK